MQKLTYVYGDGYVAALWSEYRMHGFSADFGAVRGANSLEDHYQRQQERLTELRQRIDVAQQENALVRWLATASNGDTIRRCINDNVCNTLTPALHANIDLFRKFYALGSPWGTKMDVDQQRILQHLNEFVMVAPNGVPYGKITSLSFGSLQRMDVGNTLTSSLGRTIRVYQLPLQLRIEFDQHQRVMWFLRNIEQRIGGPQGVYMVLDALSYDITQSAQRQSVEVTILAFFYDLW